MNLVTSRDRVRYVVNMASGRYEARQVRGEEGLSRPSRFEVRFAPERPQDLNLEGLVGQLATIEVDRVGVAHWGGISRVIILQVTDVSLELTATGGRTGVEVIALLEGPMARLRYRTDIRVYRDLTVPQIVQQVLEPHRIHCKLALTREYAVRPYTVHFRETDFDFVHRLLEDEGLHYRCLDGALDATHDDEQDLESRILLADAPGAYEELPYLDRVPYAAASLLDREEESITSIAERSHMVAGTITVRDWSYDRPSYDLVGRAAVPGPVAAAEDYVWPGGFENPADGDPRARRRAEAVVAHRDRVIGTSDVTRLAPGLTFAVDGAPGDFDGIELVAVTVRHHFEEGAATRTGGVEAGSRLTVDFEALEAKTIFRPLPVTPRPIVEGVLEGVVCGPAGEDVHTEAMGRVKVRFPWDRKQEPGPDVSHWVPVLQDNTAGSGAMPRVGWEVLCAFTEGDPDRPVVLGRLYNGADPFPTELPAGKTKSALRSVSSPGRSGTNAIWLDDKAGGELISVYAERDQVMVVDNDRTEKVVETERLIVEKDETVEIGRDRKTTITSQHISSVEQSQTVRVGGNHRLKVGAGWKEVIEKTRSLTIGGSHLRKIGGEDQQTVTGALKEAIGGLVLEASLKENQHTAGLISTLTVGGAIVEITGKQKSEQVEMLRVETILGALKTKATNMISLKAKAVRKAKLASLTVKTTLTDLGFFATKASAPPDGAASGAAAAAGPPPMTIDLIGTGSLAAKEIVIAVKETRVSLTAEKIEILAKGGKALFEGDDADVLAKGATLNC